MVLVLLVPLFLGVLQVALVMYVRNTATSAASEGARLAATADHDLEEGAARTRSQLDQVLNVRTQVRSYAVDVGGAPARRVEVLVSVPALGLGGPAVELIVRGTAIEETP